MSPGAATLSAIQISVSHPPEQGYFRPGQAPSLNIRFTDGCGRTLPVSTLGTASLFLSGPGRATLTRTASKLLNCVTDRAAPDGQHHFINLANPSYADPKRGGLSVQSDSSLAYQLGAVSDEPSGTYTIGVMGKSKDQIEQVFSLAALQIDTATAETYASGAVASSSCAGCHRGAASGKLNLQHSIPGYTTFGDYAIDQSPVGTCKGCHNLDGLSPNPLLRKVHGVHRGGNLTHPGVAHPEYGLSQDRSLTNFTNVHFPSMPDGEKDCTKCHADDRWAQLPSRLACGTCHDNVYFDTGKVDPPTPLGGTCKMDSDCSGLSALAQCNVAAGACEIRAHSPQADDTSCPACHTPGTTGAAPIRVIHQIADRTLTPGLRVKNLGVSGGSGPGGVVRIGDTPSVHFQLQDRTGASVKDVMTNRTLSGTVIVSGPTSDRQRVYGPLSMSQGMSYDDASDSYTFVFPSAFPSTASVPFNSDPGAKLRDNPPGTYTAWVYVVQGVMVNGQSLRDSGGALFDFAVAGAADPVQPVRPRQVILQEACDSCHVTLQAHGGTRRQAEGCSMCHTLGAQDRRVGALGAPCAQTSQCGGAAAGWEACIPTNGDSKPDTCSITADPTPGQQIYFPVLIHGIHFARKLGGYAERNHTIKPGALMVVGYLNTPNDFSDLLFPQDVRNCQKCHADSGAQCSAMAPCGVGQGCASGTCKNTAWQNPSGVVCLSCHDTEAANAHVSLMTYHAPDGSATETCVICHGAGAEFAIDKVHNVTSPYVPPYSRD